MVLYTVNTVQYSSSLLNTETRSVLIVDGLFIFPYQTTGSQADIPVNVCHVAACKMYGYLSICIYHHCSSAIWPGPRYGLLL